MEEFRAGTGFDVHRLETGRDLILGGVKIPYEKGLLGHSDADVLLHAICDCILGAAALGDIGRHFPDCKVEYEGISSLVLLKKTVELALAKGWEIVNVDATVICQKPRISPHIEKMRNNVAEALGIDIERINIKATTTEKLGYTGRGEGIASEAVCMIKRNI